MPTLSEKTKAYLTEAGWSPDRSVDLGIIRQYWKDEGYPAHPIAEDFLKSFAFLKVFIPTDDGGVDEFELDPVHACETIFPERVREEYDIRVGRPLCVIGMCYNMHMVMMMDAQGAVYGGYDETLIRIAESGEKALEILCRVEDKDTVEIPMLEEMASGVDYKKLFEDEFDNPIVEMGPTAIQGIHTGAAYDESWLAEDPFSPGEYILTEDGFKDSINLTSIKEALSRVDFDPASEEEALAAAQLYFRSNDLILGTGSYDHCLTDAIPKEVRDQVKKPFATEKDGNYEVVFYIYFQDHHMLWFEPDSDQEIIYKYVFQVGKDTYRFSSKKLWSKR